MKRRWRREPGGNWVLRRGGEVLATVSRLTTRTWLASVGDPMESTTWSIERYLIDARKWAEAKLDAA